MVVVLIAVIVASAGESAAPAFAKRPTIAKTGNKTFVSFAADRETDVAVYVEDAQGRTVRHLAAGVLATEAPAAPLLTLTNSAGVNLVSAGGPPPPFRLGLAQTVEWDGRDDFGVQCSVFSVQTDGSQPNTEHRTPNTCRVRVRSQTSRPERSLLRHLETHRHADRGLSPLRRPHPRAARL